MDDVSKDMRKNAEPKTGLVFGVFDGFHEGHRYFLSEALKQCDDLVVAVTLPEIVMEFKNRVPRFSYEIRAQAVSDFDPRITVIPSDKKTGTWSVFKQGKSYSVFLGYDQQAIARELEQMDIPYTFIGSHHPDKYKSSLLHGQN